MRRGSEKILKYIAENKNITTTEIAGIVDISTRAVEKQISRLKDKSILQRVGADIGKLLMLIDI